MTANPQEKPKLRRALTTPLLTLYGLGVTVGAGIYVLVGATAQQAGAYASFSFLVAAVVVSLTALSYAELSTRYPVSAGEAAYVEAGFDANWLTVLVGVAVAASGMISASAVAMGAASYLHGLVGFPEPVLTIGVVVIMGLIAMWGIAESVVIAAVITVIEIFGLLFVVAWGQLMSDPHGFAAVEMIPSFDPDIWRGILAASLLAFFAFVGFEDMANVAEEVKDPVKTIPKAIIWTLLLATGLYIATSATVLMVVPLDTLSQSAAPLSLVFTEAQPSVKQGFGVIAIVATVNGVLIQTIMASRVLYGLADRGHLPEILARVGPKTQTPVVATLVVVGIILVLTQALPIAVLAERTSQIVLLVFVLVNLSLIRLKYKGVSSGAHFQVPLAVPILGVATSAMLFAAGFL
ncbi:APC family permease [Shimia abyssi]|uniref:Amino acid/polyamine/organocation transporter (APC superfamily) n=1 Tax=Shimia abyssi TaxID=1662395 RepID=A0A2P8EVX9_9RHOB|nr:amino acid permease [Shimia abyssi]PSL13585.1 amino acid/polyamine/organocation transporter (APC superfamily) [Shimia abyssi]